jgi:hypothetical protein
MNLQNPNDDELQMIEEMGSTGFLPGDIAEVLEVDFNEFMEVFKNTESKIYKTFRKGFLLGLLKLRKRVAKDAEHGSSPAQTLMHKIYDECKYVMNHL